MLSCFFSGKHFAAICYPEGLYFITHTGTYFRYNMLKKIARMLPLKIKFIGDNPSSEPKKPGSTLTSNFIMY
jgi:hypothetical protein